MRYLSKKRYDLIKSDSVCGAPLHTRFKDHTPLFSPVGKHVGTLEINGFTYLDPLSTFSSPTPPVSVGDGEISLIHRGRNIFYNGYGYPTDNLYHYELWAHEIFIGDFRVTETGIKAMPRNASSFHLRKTVYKRGVYTLSAKAENFYRAVIVLLDSSLSPISKLSEEWTGWEYNTGYNGWWKTVYEDSVLLDIPSEAVYFKIGFIIMGDSEAGISDIQLEYGKTATGYTKYAEKTGTLPNSLKTSEGKEIPISLRSVGSGCDSLYLSWDKGIAKYKRAIGEQRPEDTQWTREEADGCVSFRSPANEDAIGVLCSLFPEGCKAELSEGESSFYKEGNNLRIDTKNAELMALSGEELKALLIEKGAVILYEMAEPQELELQEDALDYFYECLSLPVKELGEDTYLEINSATPPQKSVIMYYTAERGDFYTLNISCLDSNGDALGEVTQHEIRQGAIFTANAPIIDGYRPLLEKIDGVMKQDTEIKFIYEKEINDETL